ncbi:hypothetical protein C2845_PMPSC011948 [Panicum miliaceum]|uniref:CUE domain-containing protein n=1 Tax=Panicum miliaceum TaxID=4540 RepID=A0A3L6P9R5_PANMI|nr:hypothetical protein C2845_PMPSC011948 [Panicum miliaceum]
MAENLVLDGLLEVFPQVDFSTLIEVSIQFKDDIDSAADYVMQNVLPNIIPDPSHPKPNDDLYIHGHELAFDHTRTQLGFDPELNGTNSNSVHFDQNNNEKADNLMLHASSERRTLEISASEGDMSLHDDGSAHVTLRSSYSVNLESLDNVIADEHYKKKAELIMNFSLRVMSNVAAISEMLQEVELNEEKTKRAISEANQAGNDILVKVEELKEMTTQAMEDNNKVAGEIFAEKSILATEVHELQTRLFNISEETKSFVVTIDELRQLLTDRGHAVDALHGEMIGIFDCITQLKLKVDMQLPVDEQWQHVSSSLSSSGVDVPAQVPVVLSSSSVDKPLQQDPSILSSSAVNDSLKVPLILAFDEDLDQVASMLSSRAFDGSRPLQLVSSRLSSLARSARSDRSLAESLASKSSWSSAEESGASLMDDERTAGVSGGDFALDDSWDVVDDEETIVTPVEVKSTPMLL